MTTDPIADTLAAHYLAADPLPGCTCGWTMPPETLCEDEQRLHIAHVADQIRKALGREDVPSHVIRHHDGELDEVHATNPRSIHLELMDTGQWWLGIITSDNTVIHINLGVINKRAATYAHAEAWPQDAQDAATQPNDTEAGPTEGPDRSGAHTGTHATQEDK